MVVLGLFLGMPYRRFITSLFWLFTLRAAAFCLNAYISGVDPNGACMLGLDYSHAKREGFYDFPSLRKSQLLPRNDANFLGVSVGKRWGINKYIRLETGIGFQIGSADDDTLFLVQPGLVKYSFTQYGFESVLQFPVSLSPRTKPFFLVGGGVNYTLMRKRTFALDKSTEYDYYDLPLLYIRSGAFSFHPAAGFGLDHALSRGATVSLWYEARYLQPVRYGIKEDFLLDAQRYHETFLCHHFHLALLFGIR
jgi:hypothetical protein